MTVFNVQDAFISVGKGTCYRLVGAVIYYGHGKQSGHYTSYFLDHNQKQWFLADDEIVNSC